MNVNLLVGLSVINIITIILLIAAGIMAVILISFILWNKKQQRQMDAQQDKIDAAKQHVTMLVIDKQKIRLKDAGLPQFVVDQTPRLMRRSKLPMVKAKIGPKIMNLVAESDVYEMIPLKQEVKATLSGIYITEVRAVRGPALKVPK
ncbi:MAG: hypothetical protein IJL97_02645, partial [Lachnospiraceae bacterium]|nr:hypothetical protein [Lachnospiraceae bacterium]